MIAAIVLAVSLNEKGDGSRASRPLLKVAFLPKRRSSRKWGRMSVSSRAARTQASGEIEGANKTDR
jgi:hypothetical protein